MWWSLSLLDVANSGFTFELSNFAYSIFGIGVGMMFATLRNNAAQAKTDTRLALVELRLFNIESALTLRRPPAVTAPPESAPPA